MKTLSMPWFDHDGAKELVEQMQADRDQVMLLANELGACVLNGKPAILEAPAKGGRGGFWKVSAKDGSLSMLLPFQAISETVRRHGGKFTAREVRRFACC